MAETSFSRSPGNSGPSRGISPRPRICTLLLVTTLVSIASKNVSAIGRFYPFNTRTSTLSPHRILQPWHRHKHKRLQLTLSLLRDVARIPRGGSPPGVDVDDDEDDDDEGDEVEETEVAGNDEEKETTAEEADEEDEDGDDEDEYDQEEEDEDEYDEEDEEDDDEEEEADGTVEEATEIKYDEPFALSPMTSLYASVVVMLTCKKIDMFNPKVVRLARFVFISYIVVLQLFLLHVRVQAKKRNDRTAITLQNPLSSALRSQLESSAAGAGGDGMKNGGSGGIITQLASSFLSSTSTVVEYDLKQALNMQGGVVFNMLFMWILHFKMEQVQPLFLQAATGLLNLCTCPLFQIYVLKRNLERPFKNPHVAARLEEAAKLQAEREGRTTPSDEDDSKDVSEAEGQQADVSLESTSAEEEEEKDEGRVEGEPEEPVAEAEGDDVEPTAEDTEEEVTAASTDKEGAEGKGNEGDEAEGGEETDGQGDEAEDVLEDDEEAAT